MSFAYTLCAQRSVSENFPKYYQVFLDLARVIFDEQTSIDFTVLKILVNFLNLIGEKIAKIFDIEMLHVVLLSNLKLIGI